MFKKIIEFILMLFKKRKPVDEVIEEVDDNITIEDDSEFFEEDDVTACCRLPEETTEIPDTDWKQYDGLVVIIDCGHGQKTAGKRSPAAGGTSCEYPDLKLWEYEWNRKAGRKIAEVLKKNGVEVKFTVDPSDVSDPSLTTRYKRANAFKDERPGKHCVFVSVHVNAAGSDGKWHTARGFSVWTTKGQNNSDKLADEIWLAANEILPHYNQKLRKDTSDGDWDWESNFTVIYGANMPAVLTENLFQDNPEDVEFLLSDEGVEAIAEYHRLGILRFAERMWKY